MNVARGEQMRLRPEDKARPGVATVDEARHRRAKLDSSAMYTAKELAELRMDHVVWCSLGPDGNTERGHGGLLPLEF